MCRFNHLIKKGMPIRNNKMTLEDFAHRYCDVLYEPMLPTDCQCTGWKVLRSMVKNKTAPTTENMDAFHPNLRAKLLSYWHEISMFCISSHD